MGKKPIHILSTGTLATDCILLAQQNNIQLDNVPFIHTKPISNTEIKDLVKHYCTEYHTVIFTSKQAVKAVAIILGDSKPDWQFFCIEGATRKEILETWKDSTILGTAPNGAELAKKIIASRPEKEIVFFCGESRLNEIPDRLSEEGICYKEVVVYQTLLTPQVLKNEYDAILFFSPSGVKSFFSCNQQGKAILFSIGETTTQELRQHTNNKIITCLHPDKSYMLEQVIQYFK